MLERGLSNKNISIRKLNIWDDKSNAAFVRSVAGGNEVVPTVTFAGESLVNPSVAAVSQLIARNQ